MSGRDSGRAVRAGVVALSLALSISASGCGQNAELRNWPSIPVDTESVLIIVETDSTFEIRAEAWTPSLGVRFEIEDDSVLRVFAYTESLSDLGWSAGPQNNVDSNACGARRLSETEPAASFESSLGLQWEELPNANAFTHIFLAGPCPCRTIRRKWSTEILGNLSSQSQVAVVEDTAYAIGVRDRDTETWILPLTEGSTGTTLSPSVFSGGRLDAHWTAPDGAIWLSGTQIMRWDTTTTSAEFVHRPSERTIGLSGAPAGAPFEVFTSESQARVERFDGQTWELVYQPGISNTRTSQIGGVAWTAPGRAVVSLEDQEDILFYEHGTPPVLRSAGAGFLVASLVHTDWTEVLLASTTGEFARVVDGDFEILKRVVGADPVGVAIALVPLPGAAFYVTVNGFMGEVRNDVGVCVPDQLTDFSEFLGAARHGDELVVIGNTRSDAVRAVVLTLE